VSRQSSGGDTPIETIPSDFWVGTISTVAGSATDDGGAAANACIDIRGSHINVKEGGGSRAGEGDNILGRTMLLVI